MKIKNPHRVLFAKVRHRGTCGEEQSVKQTNHEVPITS